jgi:hypothetical protein
MEKKKKIKLERQTIINIDMSIIHNALLLNLKLSIVTSGHPITLPWITTFNVHHAALNKC